MRQFIQLALIVAALAAPAAAQAQINKCVDASGKTVYSQTPCPSNAKASSVRAAPPAPSRPTAAADGKSAVPSGPKSAAELEQEFRKRRTAQEEAAKKEQEKLAETQVRDENCRAARGQLASLEAGARQARINEKGERVFLDESQTARETERMRKIVQDSCR